MLKSSSNSSYSEVVKQEQKKKRNTQGIFDRQIELCEFFAVVNAHLDVNYKVNNDCTLIRVCYDKNSQWNANQGKRTLWKLVEKYKLDLIGYERQGIRFTKVNAPWCKKKIICDYSNLMYMCFYLVKTIKTTLKDILINLIYSNKKKRSLLMYQCLENY